MILPFDHEAHFKAVQTTFGRECADVFIQRGLIAEKDKELVAQVLTQLADAVELAVTELTQRNLIALQNRAVAVEFMKRVARRIQLEVAKSAKGEAGRNSGSSRARAYRILKRNRMLTDDRLTTLVTRLVGGVNKPAA